MEAMAADTMQRIARLTPLDAVLALIQSRVRALTPRHAAIAQSLGAVLAEDVRAAECPPRPIALRDGFAVAATEIADAGPYAPQPLTLTARRIDTGDVLPSGTDAVAPLDAIVLRGNRAEAARLAGGRVEDLPMTAPLRRKVTSTIGMTEVNPVGCSAGMAEPLGSGYLSVTALARSDGWILVPAESEGFAVGSDVA